MKQKETTLQQSMAETLNLEGVKCPINFVKIKLKLEEMESGELLEALVDDVEAVRNVPRMIKEEGHRIVGLEDLPGQRFRVLIQKGEGGSPNG